MDRLLYERTRKVSCKQTARRVLIEVKPKSWRTLGRSVSGPSKSSKRMDPVQLSFIWSKGSIRALRTYLKTKIWLESEYLAVIFCKVVKN